MKIDGDIADMMRKEVLSGEEAVTLSMHIAGGAVKSAWRSQVTGAGLGQRLANAIQDDVYPKKPSLGAAALVYSKAPKITAAHEAGVTIRASGGLYIAIPLPAAGRGPNGASWSPATWQFAKGVKLQFIRTRRGAMLVAQDARISGAALKGGQLSGGVFARNRRKTRRDGIKTGATTVPIFALVPQVKLPKRLNLYPAAERIAAAIPGNIVANWRSKA